MNFLIRKISQWKWAKENPKKTYIYAMVLFVSLFVINFILEIFVFEQPKKSTLFPMLYTKSDKVIQQQKDKDEQLKIIHEELKGLQFKRENGLLNTNDSLRIEFLYEKYQTLRNEK